LPIVFEELDIAVNRILGAAASVFVRDDFLIELKRPPFFWIGPELANRIGRGQSPLLSDAEVAVANTSGGLNLVLWHMSIDPEQAMRDDIRMQVPGSFLESHRGYRLKEFIALQATFAQEAQWISDSGSLFLDPSTGKHTVFSNQNGEGIIAAPHVFGLTRELALMRMTWTTSLFLYEAPKAGFSPSEQRLLLAAMRGQTDEDLSDELTISLSAVKKTWSSIYERAASHLPDFGLTHDAEEGRRCGDRGKQKKQRLLAYLREHPEELRPYSRRERNS
jgi:DNA-binding CsgD family transcriptional regulator